MVQSSSCRLPIDMPAPNAEDFFLFFFYITGRRAPEPFLGPMFGLVQSCWDLWDTAHDKGALAASDPGGTTYCSSIIFFVSLPDAHRRRWDCTRVGCVLVLGAGCWVGAHRQRWDFTRVRRGDGEVPTDVGGAL